MVSPHVQPSFQNTGGHLNGFSVWRLKPWRTSEPFEASVFDISLKPRVRRSFQFFRAHAGTANLERQKSHGEASRCPSDHACRGGVTVPLSILHYRTRFLTAGSIEDRALRNRRRSRLRK